MSETKFKKDYAEPIEAGMAKDGGTLLKRHADERLIELSEKMAPFIHRRNNTVLLNDIGSMQQVVIHVRPTKEQRALYSLFRKHQRATNANGFLQQFSTLRPIHNHPATVLYKTHTPTDSPKNAAANKKEQSSAKEDTKLKQEGPTRRNSTSSLSSKNLDAGKKEQINVKGENDSKPASKFAGRDSPELIDLCSDSDEEEVTEEIDENSVDGGWWEPFVEKVGEENIKDVQNGNKCVILLQIVAKAAKIGEKTRMFYLHPLCCVYLLSSLSCCTYQQLFLFSFSPSCLFAVLEDSRFHHRAICVQEMGRESSYFERKLSW
jgi:hypothetical protein